MTRSGLSGYCRLFLLACSIVLLTYGSWHVDYWRSPATSIFHEPPVAFTKDGIMDRPNNESYGNINLSIFFYIISADALHEKPLTDLNIAAYALKSRSELVHGSTYRVGDWVQVNVVLFDGYGNPKRTGGDSIRARMYESSVGAYIAGHVTDCFNGTYIVTFLTCWAGTQTISIHLQYARETIRMLYYAHEPVAATRPSLVGVFSSRGITEETACHPMVAGVGNYTTGELCYNAAGGMRGMPMYCVPPKNRKLTCGTLTDIRHVSDPVAKSRTFTDAEKLLFKRPTSPIGGVLLTVSVREGLHVHGPTDEKDLPQCSTSDLPKLWTGRYPTGYFYHDIWHPHMCRLATHTPYIDCLRGKKLLIFGDSTTRQWYLEVLKYVPNCHLTTEPWTKSNWQKFTECLDSTNNITIQWIPHSFSFYYGPRGSWNIQDMKTIPGVIDEVHDDDDVIIVIHMFLHALRYHEDVFRMRMVTIRQSVERLLLRNPTAVVTIKGPHAYVYMYSLEDFYGYVYRDILFDVFKGLHDRVVYLDYREMCIAKGILDRHPPDDVIREMVRLLLGFSCRV